MRKTAPWINYSTVLGLIIGITGQAQAQTAAPAASAAPAPAAAAPAPTSAPATAAPTPAGPATPAEAPVGTAPANPAAAAATPPAEPPPASYFRIDDDYQFGIQLWAGATHPVGEGIGLSSDIYIAEGAPGLYNGAVNSWYGEFDLGPAFTFGPLSLTPMAGIAFDWGAKHVTALNAPQLYTILNTDKIYIESWLWTLLYSPFKEQAAPNQIHTRDWILYKLSGTLSIGPQFELWANLKHKSIMGVYNKAGLTAMPIGGHIEIAYGTGNSLGLFVGYDANKDGRDARGGNAAVGRFTFVHNF